MELIQMRLVDSNMFGGKGTEQDFNNAQCSHPDYKPKTLQFLSNCLTKLKLLHKQC